MLLEGKVAIVSGVGPGLGRATALAFAAEGASVVLAARTSAYVEQVADELGRLGSEVEPVVCDITDVERCSELVTRAVERFGQVDVLVNNAFKPDPSLRFEDVDLAQWREIVDVNVFGSLQLTQHVVPVMKERGSGSIIFVNAMVVRRMLPGLGGLAISKGALVSAAQLLALELGQYGIRVNSIVPGMMWGPTLQGYFEYLAASSGRTVDEQRNEAAREIPLGSIPLPEECARVAVFLASGMSATMTGQLVDTNGGQAFG